MSGPIRVMVEQGRKRAVASAFDWPGWGRSAKGPAVEGEALAVLAAYRTRFAPVAGLAGLGDEFVATGELEVVERLAGTGMGDFYGVSGQTAESEYDQMSEAACERKIALLRASWAYFDGVAARVSAELRMGPRGGGRGRDRIVRHVNGAEIDEHAKKVGVRTPLDALRGPRGDPRPSRRVRRWDPRVQRPGPVGRRLDRPVPDPALRLAHARPRLGDGGPGPVVTIGDGNASDRKADR